MDVLTTAELAQLKAIFHSTVIVGKAFPHALVRSGRQRIEVSSFLTKTPGEHRPPPDLALVPPRDAAGLSWAAARAHNALMRDFTVNALIYDPFSELVFDYAGGWKDLWEGRLRCISDPWASFKEDPVRMLRAVRLAARVGLTMDRATVRAIRESAPEGMGQLPRGRVFQEFHSLMAHGAARASFELLWRAPGCVSAVAPKVL